MLYYRTFKIPLKKGIDSNERTEKIIQANNGCLSLTDILQRLVPLHFTIKSF